MTVTAGTDFFARSVRERLFVPQPDELRRVGLEVELLPLLADSGLPCPLGLRDRATLNTLDVVRRFGNSAGWQERRSAKGAPYFTLARGGTLTFEPGGQLELCTPPCASISGLLADVRATLGPLRRAASDAGIELLSVGIDPRNDIAAVPLQIESDRYSRMTRYFDRVGPSGVRMMRQTAATQVSLDAGSDPAARWRLLCDLAPYLTAMFANSPRYAGAKTRYASFRAHCWRRLDRTRTGVPRAEESPCEAYTQFALDAVDMWRVNDRDDYLAFGEWVTLGAWNETQWEEHLSTLFPEVRPRGYLEVRSIDALDEDMLIAPILLLAGLVYSPEAAAEARMLLAPANEELLNRAARCGVHDGELADIAFELAEIGLRGALDFDENLVTGEDFERASEFFVEYTRRGRTPGDRR